MKTLPLLIVLALPLHATEPNTLSPEESKDGFTLIFDGKTLDGWRTYKQEKPKDQWKVVDGAITLTTPGGGDLITSGQFENFELRLQFKIAPDGNSGIMWHVAEIKGAPYLTGPEYQILDSFDHPNHKYDHETAAGNVAGCFYGFTTAKPEWSKPVGEWNDARIRIDGSKITLYLNGHKTADFDTSGEEYKALLAKSKFADWKKFNAMEKGHICFQDHGDVVSFRNIRVKTLK